MILVDTSIWVDHLRKDNRHLEKLLLDAEVVCHPFVIGELACAHIKNRSEILSLLQSLPVVPSIDPNEYLYFINQNSLYGSGIGFVDIHLLASARLLNLPIWTADKRLRDVAVVLKLSYR
jgi:predicted nucleic acid-binding protein